MDRNGARIAGIASAVLLTLAGCSSDDSTGGGGGTQRTWEMSDLAYVHGRYYFLQLPASQIAAQGRIDFATLRVFVDDRNGSNDAGTRDGYAELDPTAPPGTSPRISGHFDPLRELTDYTVSLADYGEMFPVLELAHEISPYEVLAVTYRETLPGGAVRDVGVVPDCPGGGAPCDTMRLKALQVPLDLLPASAADPAWFETDPALSPFAATREYECRSYYQFAGATNLDPARVTVSVRRYDAGLDEPSNGFQDGLLIFTYLQMLGLDGFTDAGGGSPIPGPDGTVDAFTNAMFLDSERGILHFPDLRPFDPRLTGRPDARPEDDWFFRSRVPGSNPDVPGLRGRVLWPQGVPGAPGLASPGIPPPALWTNPRVYDKRNLDFTGDRRYFIELSARERVGFPGAPVAP